MDNPIHLSDSQLEQLLRAAAPLAPKDRSPSLADVAEALRGQALGDGAVFRIIREIQGRYFHPPEFSTAPGNTGAEWRTGRLSFGAQPHDASAAFLDLQGLPATHCLETRLLSPSAGGFASLRRNYKHPDVSRIGGVAIWRAGT